MGKRISDGVQDPNGNISEQAEGTGTGTTETDGRGNSSTETATASPRGRGRGRRGTGTTEETKLPELAIVTPVEKTPEQLAKEERRRQQKRDSDARRRERLKLEKEGKAPASKKPATKKQVAAVTNSIKTDQLNILVLTVSNIIASREGMGHWKLSPVEVEQIMTPLSNILSKYDKVGDTLGQYADHIALVMALGTILVPRLILQFQLSKAKKEGGKEIDKLRTRPSEPVRTNESTRTTGNSDKPVNEKPSSVSTNVSGILSDLIPAVGTF